MRRPLQEISAACELDGIITVVDTKHIVQHLEEEKPEGAENESVEQACVLLKSRPLPPSPL